jgi:hypothetical protein
MEERIMALPTYTSALIVGAGPGLSASLTRLLTKEGLAVAPADLRAGGNLASGDVRDRSLFDGDSSGPAA